MTRSAVAALLIVANAVVAGRPASAQPTFDVASVKRSVDPATTVVSISIGEVRPGGVWRSTFATVLGLIRTLYPGHAFPGQIDGLPDWARTEFYDIEARAVPPASAEAMHEMARTLLAERFKLRMHRETREVPAYLLVTARKDGRLGPGLTRPAIDCDAYRAAKERGDTLPTDPTRKPFADRLACATTVMPVFDHTRVVPGADWRLTAGGATIGSLVTLLARDLGRPVIDKTGVTQRFDVEVQYSVELRPGAEPGPPLQAALADQLGLNVEDAKAAVDVLVIDHVERPDPN